MQGAQGASRPEAALEETTEHGAPPNETCRRKSHTVYCTELSLISVAKVVVSHSLPAPATQRTAPHLDAHTTNPINSVQLATSTSISISVFKLPPYLSFVLRLMSHVFRTSS